MLNHQYQSENLTTIFFKKTLNINYKRFQKDNIIIINIRGINVI